MKSLGILLVSVLVCLSPLDVAIASNFSVAPYVSMKSKTVKKADRNNPGQEVTKTITRTEYGIRGSLRFLSILKASLSVGQNEVKKEEEVGTLTDEYGEIDFENDLGTSGRDPADEITMTETQRNAKLTIAAYPKVGPIILMAGAGVTARQRIITSSINGEEQPTITSGPTYKPHSTFGAGFRLTPRNKVMVEYELYHYAFPEIEPFERSVTVSVSIGI